MYSAPRRRKPHSVLPLCGTSDAPEQGKKMTIGKLDSPKDLTAEKGDEERTRTTLAIGG